jgi:purine-binding chemotaxis protein CheW
VTVAQETTNDLVQLVSFKLGDEEYGVNILQVQEINRMAQITRVPQAPHYCEGVINLRGKVIPVIDLRQKFELQSKEKDQQTRIVVCDVAGSQTGMIVDSVQEVLRIPRSALEPCPAAVTVAGQDYLEGIVKLEDRLILFLSLDRLAGEMTSLSSTPWSDVAAVEA